MKSHPGLIPLLMVGGLVLSPWAWAAATPNFFNNLLAYPFMTGQSVVLVLAFFAPPLARYLTWFGLILLAIAALWLNHLGAFAELLQAWLICLGLCLATLVVIQAKQKKHKPPSA